MIESARELFIEYGIQKVRVEEICRHAGVSKGTYYKHFSNKLELVVSLIEDIQEASSRRFVALIQDGVSFEVLLKHLIEEKLRFMERYSTRFMKDLYEGTIPELHDVIVKMQQESHAQARAMYNNAVSRGDIDDAVSFEFFLYLLGTVQNMFMDKTVIEIYPDPVTRMQVVFQNFFYGILKRNHPSSGPV